MLKSIHLASFLINFWNNPFTNTKSTKYNAHSAELCKLADFRRTWLRLDWAHGKIKNVVEDKFKLFLECQVVSSLPAFAQSNKPDAPDRKCFLDCDLTECLNLCIRDIDFDRETVKVTGKGDKDRYISIPKKILHLLKRQTKGPKPLDNGRKAHISSLCALLQWRCWKAASKNSYLATYATHLLEAGRSLKKTWAIPASRPPRFICMWPGVIWRTLRIASIDCCRPDSFLCWKSRITCPAEALAKADLPFVWEGLSGSLWRKHASQPYSCV